MGILSNSSSFKKPFATISLVALLLLVTVGTLESANALPLHAGVIRITPEGTVEGTDKISQNGNVYTLTGDIQGTVEDGATFISIEKDGIVF